jgi:heme-degrading monooxygenase HmoA
MTPTPPFDPPYVTVIFVNQRTDADEAGYGHTADAMVALAEGQPGYLGHDSVRGADGFGITVSYWRDEESILAWKAVGAHRAAQAAGQRRWYAAYTTHVARVERAYAMSDAAVAGKSPAPEECAGA